MKYQGSCHCGSIRFSFESEKITSGLKCNCSICRRKGATMTSFTLAPNEIEITIEDNALATYEFGNGVAKHHFCNRCGIYPFHQTMRNPGQYRINTGCLADVDSTNLEYDVFDGASL